MRDEAGRKSVYLLPTSESNIRDLVEEINFNHPVKGKINSMYVVHSDVPGRDRFCIEIVYSKIPYPGEHDYSDFERDMAARLQANMPTFVAVPVDIYFECRETGDLEEEE